MPRRAAIEPIRVPGRARPWKVEIPASIADNGKRSRYFFETKADAANFADELQIRIKNFGTHGAGIAKPSELEQLALAATALKPFGVTSQPTRAPVMAYVLDVENTESTRSSASSDAGLTCGMPYVNAS